MTLKQLLNQVASKLGIKDPDEDLTANQYSVITDAVNALLGEWAGKRFTLFSEGYENLTLTAETSYEATTSYFEKLLQCQIKIDDVKYPVKIITETEMWEIKLNDAHYGRPEYCFLDRDHDSDYDGNAGATSYVSFYPIPDIAYDCYILGIVETTELATLSSTIYVPRSYRRALILQAAIDVASAFNVQVTTDLYNDADKALRSLEALNSGVTTGATVFDPSLPGLRGRGYDIESDY